MVLVKEKKPIVFGKETDCLWWSYYKTISSDRKLISLRPLRLCLFSKIVIDVLELEIPIGI